MSNQSVNVGFKVSGGELDSYMANVKKKSADISNEAIKAAISQTERGKELLDITNQQIRALEKRNRLDIESMKASAASKRDELIGANREKYMDMQERLSRTKFSPESKARRASELAEEEKLIEKRIRGDYRGATSMINTHDREQKMQTTLAKEQIETIKATAKENVKAISSGDLKLADVIRNASTDEEKLVAKLTQEGVAKEKKLQGKGDGSGFLTSMLTIDNLQKFVATASQIGQTQNGFDQIGNTGRAISQAVGGVIGGLIGSFVPGGTLAGASIGGSIGNLFGGTGADFLQRQAIEKQRNLGAYYRYSGTTGQEPGTFDDTSGIGVSATDFLNKRLEFAKRRGYSASSAKTAADALYAERGFGIDGNTSAGLVELQRSQKENNRDLANLIGGVLQKGSGSYFKNGDTTFLNEFLSRFTTLQKDLLKTSSTVGTATTYDILSRFNNVGGAFSTADPRSGGLISTINSSLANPGTDMKRALSFYALKKNNPNMSLAELIEEQQKGLGSANYLESIMSLVDNLGGDNSARRLNFAGALGLEGNQAFASQLYSGYRSGKFRGGFAKGEISSLYDFKGRAEGNTSDIDKNSARIQNALLGDSSEAVEAMVSAIQNGLQNALAGSIIEMANGKITFASRATIQKNVSTATRQREIEKAQPAIDWQNLNNSSSTGAFYK